MRSNHLRWTNFVTRVSLFVCSLVFSFSPLSQAQQPMDRTAYIRSAYKALESITSILIGSGVFKDTETQEFLNAVNEVLSEGQPQLIFVNDSDQFIIESGSTPRLMRAPEDPSGPIFVNQELLNSLNFNLSLPQVLKLLLHELGHKTKMGSVAARDQWAQDIEALLQSHYLTSGEDTEPFIEALSLPVELIQHPVAIDSYVLQPSFWAYAHLENEVKDLTPHIHRQLNENTMLTRTIGTEILTVITELSNTFAKILKDKMAPIMDQFTMMFSEPGKKPDGFADALDNIKGPIKAMTIAELKRVSSAPGEAVFNASLVFARSHINKSHFNVTGFPWKDFESFPIQIKVHPLTNQASVQLVPETNLEQSAKVGRIIREGGVIKSMDVIFPNKGYPYTVDLGLEYPGGTMRLGAVTRESYGADQYKATFEFETSEALNTAYVERIFIDNEEVRFLNRRIEINDDVSHLNQTALSADEVIPSSIGIWGFRGKNWTLEKSFSHLQTPLLFFFAGQDEQHFVINPYNLIIEFEVKSDVDISTAELFWSSEQMIFDISESEHPTINLTEKIDGVDVQQRYAAAGKLLEQNTLRESILFDKEGVKILPSERPGYKTVRMKTITPVKHLRALKSLNEAHRLPNVIPISLRVMTKDFRSYFHTFPSKHSAEEIKSGIKGPCDELLKAVNIQGL